MCVTQLKAKNAKEETMSKMSEMLSGLRRVVTANDANGK